MPLLDFVEKLTEIVAEILEMDPGTIQPEMRLTELRYWDSIAAIVFLATMERDYGVRLTPMQVRNAVFVGDLFNLILAAAKR
jgi:acyl carrier protein